MGRIILIYIFPALIYLCRVRATCFLKSTSLLILCECKYVSCAFSVVSPSHDTECFQHPHRSDPPPGGSPPSPLQMVALFRTPLCIARVPSACALKALRWRSSCQSDPGARSRAKTLHNSWNEDVLLVLLGSRVSQSWLWTGFFSFLPVILLFSSWGRGTEGGWPIHTWQTGHFRIGVVGRRHVCTLESIFNITWQFYIWGLTHITYYFLKMCHGE